MIYNKPDYSTGVWADEGNIAYPTSEKIEQGHIVEKPFYEIMNYLQNRSDTANAYLLQNGLPEWDRLTTYPIDAYIKHSGAVYRARFQNVDAEPSPTSEMWFQAFPTYEDFLNYLEEIRKIKEDEGYLGLYVSKARPVMQAKARGVAYLANTGLISSGSEDVGYSFNQHQRDGIFHDGNSAVAMNDGVVVGKFSVQTEESSYVTLKTLKEYIENSLRYKVGDLYLTTNPQAPETTLGYGTWEKYAKGRALVGQTDEWVSGTPDWVKNGGSVFGTYEHALTPQENGKHNHEKTSLSGNGRWNGFKNMVKELSFNEGQVGLYGNSEATDWYGDTGTTSDNRWFTLKENVQTSGEGKPHNNVQPSIVIYVWRRVS